MGTHSQHIPVTAPTCASPVDKYPEQGPGRQSCEWRSGTATFREGTRCWLHLQVPRGSHPPLETPLETPQQLQLPVGFTSEIWWKCWCTRLLGFSILVLYDGRETKALYPKVRPKVKEQALTQTPEQTMLGFGLAGKQEGERRKLPPAKLPIYTTECEFTAKKIFYS